MTRPAEFELDLEAADRVFRDEVRSFLAANLPEGWGTPAYRAPRDEAGRIELQRDWHRRLHEAGLVAISWPVEHGGRGAGFVQQMIYNTEMARRRAPEPINKSAVAYIGPTIIQWGSDWQREHFLPRILSAEDVWCQGFSEPGAGSDLASLRTRAELDGEDFVVTGHKVWTSKAHYADWCYVLARTDPGAPKHRGISCLLVDLRSDGITIRPIRQISGRSEFNEVFFDGVRVPRRCLVGELNGGWRVANSTLSYERAGLSRTERIERRLDILLGLARELAVDGRPQLEDPVVREQLVRFAVKVEALRNISVRVSAAGLRGSAPGPEVSIAKLLTSELDQAMSEFGMDLAGPYAALVRGSEHAIKAGNVPLSYLIMRAATIGGGTSEIQRNLIAERVLGLPKSTPVER
ncbi:MAG: acyl-CoA dehydrogenase family protein [Gemmatimonadales bacterium]